MPRPSLPPFTLGKVSVRAHPSKTETNKRGEPLWYQARGYYIDANNKRRDVTASGERSTAKDPSSIARGALRDKVKAAEKEHQGGDDTLSESTKVGKAVAVWLDYAGRKRGRDGKPLAENTLTQYKGNARRYVTGSTVEHLTIAQVNNVARVEKWLAGIADEHGEGAAVAARKVLGNTLALAERRGAIVASVMHRVETPGASKGSAGDRKCADPDCDLDCAKRHLDTRRAFTADEARAVFTAAAESEADIADLVAFLFGTGARIREALHNVAWADVDLTAQTVRIRGTKTAAADRTVMLSDDLTDALRARATTYGTSGLVFGVTRFAGKVGQPREVNNVLKTLRTVLKGAGVPWAGSHTFRRTVATWMDEHGSPLAEIAAQLGHANTTVTTKYLARKVAPTRAASVMVLPPVERANLTVVNT